MGLLLWIIAVVLVVAGIFALIRGQLLWGIVLIVVGLAVGPGGAASSTRSSGGRRMGRPPECQPLQQHDRLAVGDPSVRDHRERRLQRELEDLDVLALLLDATTQVQACARVYGAT